MDVIDKISKLLNHASVNAHSAMKHLQVHRFDEEVIRIFLNRILFYMARIDLKVWNRLTITKGEIASEIPSFHENMRRWIAIYPNTGKQIDKNVPPHEFSVLDFELDRQLMQKYSGDEDLIMVNKKRYYLNSEQELYLLLEKLGINPALFNAPWHNEYPL